LIHGLIKLQEKIDNQSIRTVKWYSKEASEEIPIPILGPDLIDPRDFQQIRESTGKAQEPENETITEV